MRLTSCLHTVIALAACRAEVIDHCSAGEVCHDTSDLSSLLQPSAPRPSRRSATLAFPSFVRHHNRNYKVGSPEYEYRRSIYDRRADEVALLNTRPVRLWTAGVNHLSDWTYEELGRIRGWRGAASRQSGMHGATVSSHGSSLSFMQTNSETLPDEVSWAHLNASNIAHIQGDCGSCWAVTSSLTLEANHEIHQKKGRTFSAQELINCVPDRHHCGGTGGCDGNIVELALDYAMKHGLEDSYTGPYLGVDSICSHELSLVEDAGDTSSDNFDAILSPGVHIASDNAKGPSAFGLIGWERLPENKYAPLMQALVERGPVAISVFAEPWASYEHGIFDDCESDAVIDHAVTLLGYGKDDMLKEKFWLIQNSWGREWGEDGRIRLLRRDSEETECGIDRQPEVGTACEGGPKEVKVCGMCGILYDAVVPHFTKAD